MVLITVQSLSNLVYEIYISITSIIPERNPSLKMCAPDMVYPFNLNYTVT